MHESSDHAALVELFRRAPDVAATLLRGAFGVAVPEGPGRAVDPVQRPSALIPDLVLEFGEDEGRMAVIVEVQRNIDARKRMTWPAYLWIERLRRGCEVCLLVFAPDAKVAAWAAEPIECGPGNRTCPRVIGPAQVPTIREPSQIEAAPGLAALSARVHAKHPDGPAIVGAVVKALWGLDEEAKRVYLEVAVAGLAGKSLQSVRKLLQEDDMFDYEVLLNLPKARVPTPNADAFIELCKDTADMATRCAHRVAVLEVLTARGLTPTPEIKGRLRQCRDAERLKRWIGRAAVVGSSEEMLAELEAPEREA